MDLPSSWLSLGQKLANFSNKDSQNIEDQAVKSPTYLKKREKDVSSSHEKTKILRKKKHDSLMPISEDYAIGNNQD